MSTQCMCCHAGVISVKAHQHCTCLWRSWVQSKLYGKKREAFFSPGLRRRLAEESMSMQQHIDVRPAEPQIRCRGRTIQCMLSTYSRIARKNVCRCGHQAAPKVQVLSRLCLACWQKRMSTEACRPCRQSSSETCSVATEL